MIISGYLTFNTISGRTELLATLDNTIYDMIATPEQVKVCEPGRIFGEVCKTIPKRSGYLYGVLSLTVGNIGRLATKTRKALWHVLCGTVKGAASVPFIPSRKS